MKNHINRILLFILVGMLPTIVFAQSVPRYLESGGVVIIEVESAISYGDWVLDTTKVGYTGQGYLRFTGSDYFNTPGNSLLKYEIVIEKTGKYRFQWHSLIAAGQSNTEHNDSWLRFKDASDFYGEKSGQKVWPKGVGKTPNPEGSSANGWLKIYQNNLNNWTWVTRTSDRDPHEIFVEFDSVGVYTLEISGRSNGHAINRLALYHSEANSAQALSLAWGESDRVQTTSISEIPLQVLTVRPTMASSVVHIDIPGSKGPHAYQGEIVNALGQKVQSFTIPRGSNIEVAVPVSHLEQGMYFIRLQQGALYYQGKFIKNE